jgi:endothelin-converting enzyme
LDEDTVKSLGVAPLMEILKELTELFPTAAGKTLVNEGDNLVDAILYLAKLGVTALVSPGTGADDTDPDTVVVSVSPPYRIGLPAKELYTDESVVKKYENAITEVFSALYPAQILKAADVHGVVELEKKLASASPDAEDRDDVTVGKIILLAVI